MITPTFLVVHRCLIADRASWVAIASHSWGTCGRTLGHGVLMITPTFLVVHRQQFCLIADRASRITVNVIAIRASHSWGYDAF